MNIKIQQFEGPLDLLLNLIEKQKLDISQISLAKITDQYINFIQENKDIPFDSLIYFLDIASKLLILKTRLILPYIDKYDGEENEEDLVETLKKYKKYIRTSHILDKLLNNNKRSVSVQFAKRSIFNTNYKSNKITIKSLLSAIKRIEKDIDIQDLEIAKFQRIESIKEKINYIIKLIKRKKRMIFSDLISNKPSKSEIITSFLALLELVKSKKAYIKQNSIFNDIFIESKI